mgnify:CR=1 FL=1
MPLYQLEQTPTFIRTTLRHPEFVFGWKHIVDLQLTNEEKFYQSLPNYKNSASNQGSKIIRFF